MDIELVRNYCLKKKGVTEGSPFGEDALVFKVLDKMFCLINLVYPYSMNLKCDPERAVELREEYEEITPGYHMNKKHWNTIDLTGSLRDTMVTELIDHSYNLVVSGLTKKQKEELRNL